MYIHPLLLKAAGIFKNSGKQVFLVGGAVRDLFRGSEPQDWDLATDASPEEVSALFRSQRCRVIPTGIKHGTVTVLFHGHSLEVTTFRTEGDYRDGRRPESIAYAATVEEDLSRRDFTMNAIALELPSRRVVDPYDGQGDIGRRIIRCVGLPAERFSEDGLRPLRCVRFASQLGFSIEGATQAAIAPSLETTAKVSVERVRDEFDKILDSPKPSVALRLMEETGLLSLLFPALARCRGIDQRGFHRFDVLDHSLHALDYASYRGFSHLVRLAALFHDIGKPDARKLAGDKWTFHRHELYSTRKTRAIMEQYRYPNAVIEGVCHLIQEHMFHYDESWGDAAVRRFIIRAEEKYLGELYALREADAYGTSGVAPERGFLLPLMKRVEKILSQGRAFTVKDLALSGHDLQEAGIPPGKHMGIILKELLESVLDDPLLNTREKLMEIALNLNRRYD